MTELGFVCDLCGRCSVIPSGPFLHRTPLCGHCEGPSIPFRREYAQVIAGADFDGDVVHFTLHNGPPETTNQIAAATGSVSWAKKGHLFNNTRITFNPTDVATATHISASLGNQVVDVSLSGHVQVAPGDIVHVEAGALNIHFVDP